MGLTGQQILYCSENIDKKSAYICCVHFDSIKYIFPTYVCEITNECGYVTFINNAVFYIQFLNLTIWVRISTNSKNMQVISNIIDQDTTCNIVVGYIIGKYIVD